MSDGGRIPVSLVDRFTEEVQTRLGRRLQREGDVDDDELRKLAEESLQDVLDAEDKRRIDEGHPAMGEELERAAADAVRDRLFSYGPLQPYLNPGSGVSEVNINGCDEVWVTYVDGNRRRVPRLFPTDEELEAWVERQARESPRHEYRWDFAHPLLEMDLPNGDRLSAAKDVVPRPTVSIRRHDLVHLATLDDLVRVGMIDKPLRDFLEALILARKNIVVAGGTAAGKTTLLRALCNAVPRWERIITVEDVPELLLERFPEFHDQIVAMRRRPPNSDGRGEIKIDKLTWASLRHNPDRIVLGESRGPETIPISLAMSQGTEGSMLSAHSNSAPAALRKLQGYASTAPERWGYEDSAWMLADAVHVVVYVEFDRANNRRFVASICVVAGVQGRHVLTNEVFAPGPDGLAVRSTEVGLGDELLAELEAVGWCSDALSGSAA